MASKIVSSALFTDISTLIEKAKYHISREFNTTYIMLAWNIGTRISQEILDYKRASYGKSVMDDLARGLQTVSYYRLSVYCKPHQDQLHNFKPNTYFDTVWDLYAFDRALRILFVDAIER